MDRRTFLTSAASAAGAVALGCRPVGPDSPPITSSLAALPDPTSSGIDHVLVFMMEHRSLDHFLGWRRNADGRQAAPVHVLSHALPHSAAHLASHCHSSRSAGPAHSAPASD